MAFLLCRPGFLTREYLAGHRVRYTRPVQLYLVTAAAFFLVNAYRPFITFDAENRRIASSLSRAAASMEFDEEAMAGLAAELPAHVFLERFQTTIIGYLPAFLIGSVLLFALLLQVFHRREARGYVEHAVFALHWTSFYLVLMIVIRLLPESAAIRPPTEAAGGVLAFIYLCAALHRVYPGTWRTSIAKSMGLFIGFQVLLVLWMVSAIGLAFALL